LQIIKSENEKEKIKEWKGKLPIESSKKVALRLQKRLLFSGETPTLGPNVFAYAK